MKLRFSTQAFMDKEQDCTLVTYLPFSICACKACEVFDSLLQGKLEAPYILQGQSGDAAIGGFIKLNAEQRNLMFDHAINIIEENRANGLRTGIIPVFAADEKANRRALLLLVAHDPNSEHVAEQKSFTNYEALIADFFDGNPGVYR